MFHGGGGVWERRVDIDGFCIERMDLEVQSCINVTAQASEEGFKVGDEED